MSEKQCPICNRVVVVKSDQSLTCMFCGWKSAGKTPDAKLKGSPSASQEEVVRIATSPEEIAKKALESENSKQMIIYSGIGAILLLMIVGWQMTRPPAHKPERTSPLQSSAPLEQAAPASFPSPAATIASNPPTETTSPNTATPSPESTVSPTPIESADSSAGEEATASPSSEASPESETLENNTESEASPSPETPLSDPPPAESSAP
ncbi:hypothetical protein COW36_09455 [bacterium (Candidatus Blackallbacteria) CG17_big_fil_post_rev_8_21_14_2_50_48_46]|uniref:Uncharacterized protein n=1 Tax=bacterium (Candidatus Blackallbacteria) CG17_big_fil_post_rev_8_21_14_2_50_48_46 TaxID=2014261 RepID=A0A2M7G5F9_9BACT|nr:MAG: hypothetical protein COW64_01955 [bacterium (Candidatus Blackallbacteria) CG18_big_fil_WC_8_21_14_2_50_49_26]PIW17189.1 MAG: hypothetical protein COW36_09455 [bacterium (Candidatus Blackallbacteria) CG17_big_fil_post_rev_8_21_14_2_50_48_46]PIW50980.1 MAG: hypothetical protein COW20_00465 [bacterium (Candidatus Blackallbacteria) CG13_big_fil_rev_8_21_14_2_50_49_14]